MLHMAASGKTGVQIPYIAKTKGQAKRIIWPKFVRMNADYDLGLRFHRNDLVIEYPNGSIVDLLGCDDEGDIEKLRGGDYPLAVLDEAQSYREHIATLIWDILRPAMLDQKGVIAMTGTPNALCSGYFYEATTVNGKTYEGLHPTSGWSVHRWSVLDNPYLPHAAEEMKQIEAQMGSDNPTFLREWKGEWVYDGDAIIYKLDPKINIIDELPEAPDWEYLLGMDLGYTSATSFVIIAFSVATHQTVVVESWQESKLIPSAVAARVEGLRREYEFARIVADVGGLGKGYAEEMIQRFEIPIEPARKSRKLGYIELLNGDLKNGTLKLIRWRNQDLISEMRTLQWNAKRTGPYDKDDDHLTDGMLYAWREAKTFLHEPEREILPGTPEWEERETEEIWADDLKRVRGETSWWEGLVPEEPFSWDY